MFDQLKNLSKLKEMQSQLASQQITGEAQGISITIDGTMNLLEVKLNPSLSQEVQERAIKDAFADAQKKLKSLLMQSMPGLMR